MEAAHDCLRQKVSRLHQAADTDNWLAARALLLSMASCEHRPLCVGLSQCDTVSQIFHRALNRQSEIEG